MNEPIKAHKGGQYERWQSDTKSVEFQNFSGIQKRSSYEILAKWVSESVLKIQTESIKHSSDFFY